MSFSFVLFCGLLLVGCGSPPASDTEESHVTDADTSVSDERAIERADSLADQLIAHTDSAFAAIAPLSAREQERLRRYLQDEHLVLAQRLGIDPVHDRRFAASLMSQPSGESGVVRLQTNDFYIIDPRMSYAVPLVVPEAAHLLERIGRRFQRDLLEHGLPPYRFILTSVLRTGSDQAHLRGTNANAAQGQSTHEYGTTFDIYYDRFHYAAAHDSLAQGAGRTAALDEARLLRHLREAYRRFGESHAHKIKAVLGRTLLELQEEGLLASTYERQQPVYHLTVAREMTAPPDGNLPEGPGEMTPAMRRLYADMESQLSDVEDGIEDLKQDVETASAETQQRLERDVAALEEAREAFWQTLLHLDSRAASDFEDVWLDLQQGMAELERDLEQAYITAMQRERDVQYHVRTRIRETDRTISQLEGLVENAAPAVRERHEQQVSDLRSQHTQLKDLRQELEETSGAAFQERRSQAAAATGRLIANLQIASATIIEDGDYGR